ncbi:NADP-dependent oxidoreductase [Chishuiella sp.]|uniref:NADP-dependent oxidoreductase n=1 Tax=Chishuiella sp. TaxID=1969467 RepID=UPI0028AF3B58|nr:NADP-dependent oxidoreductase [Chishuiella sp.]
MKAYQVTKYRKKNRLELVDISIPNIKENEVLVEIHAAGVNLLDSMIKTGAFKIFLPYKLPVINGHDMAGKVIKVGSKIKSFKVGDEVYSRVSDFKIGTFAEYIAVNENNLAIKPKNISMEEAASIPLVALTVLQAFEKANVKKGQKIFIQAGSGGVGSIAIQIAKHIGAKVATTTGTSNLELVKNLGADYIIDYKKEDFANVLNDYDFVLHSNRDKVVLEKSLKILKPTGNLITLTGPPTLEFAKELNLPWYTKLLMKLLSASPKKLAKKLNVNFYFLFMKANGKQLAEITQLIESDIVHPIIDKVYNFEQVNDAMAYVETGRAKGKVVIKIK